MNEDDFENLVVFICDKILGASTIPFAQGKDGGKDGKFTGRANLIPSESSPWDGKIIIQAKHTNKVNASCSDSTFNTILKNEVLPAIHSLKSKGEIDYYLLFTNRKLTGNADSEIEKRIKDETGIPNILIAEEKIQNYIAEYPSIVKSAKLNQLLLPFDFDDSDIRDVVLAIHSSLKEDDCGKREDDFIYPGLEKKNELNQLSSDYFDNIIVPNMAEFSFVRDFLTSPYNRDIKDIYEDAVSELSAKITVSRERFDSFDNVIESCYDLIVSSNPTLKSKKRLVRLLLHYMYCNCEIGIKK